MIKKDLKTVVEIIAGYSFRTALQGKKNASSFVVQAKNILEDSIVDENNLDRIDFENYRSRATVKKGDVVVSSRGNFRAGVITLGLEETIASSSVYILRPKDKSILSDYLAIYLNSLEGQKQIGEKVTGAVINTILRRDLENIKIPIPDLQTQEKIIGLYFINKKLQQGLKKKMFLINNINKVAINKLIKN